MPYCLACVEPGGVIVECLGMRLIHTGEVGASRILSKVMLVCMSVLTGLRLKYTGL